MTPNIEYIALVLGDYCDLQIDGIVPAANRYPVADVMEQVELLEHLQPVANEVLARRIAELEREVSMHRNAEITWEKTMMQAVGEDGPKSVVEAIEAIKAERDNAWQELREIREAISANPEESTVDEVRRVVHQLGTAQSMHVDNVRHAWESRNCGSCEELAEKHDALAAQVEVLREAWEAVKATDWNKPLDEAFAATPAACLAQARAEEFADGGLAQKAFWEGFERGTVSHNKNIRSHWEEWSEFKRAERIRQEVE